MGRATDNEDVICLYTAFSSVLLQRPVKQTFFMPDNVLIHEISTLPWQCVINVIKKTSV